MAGELIGKVPPHNLEAETSVLGSLLIDRDAILKVGDILRPDDFYHEHHREIFRTMLELFESRTPIDLLSLGNRLEERGKLTMIGGRATLISLASSVPSASHLRTYAEIVRKKATLRRLITAATEIIEMGYTDPDDTTDILDKAETKLFSVASDTLRQQFIPVQDVLAQTFERIDELHRERGKLRGIPTGFGTLDNILAGLQKSDLIVLAARPSVGKTTLALDCVRHAAVIHKIPTGIFSLEMSREQIVDRLLCAQAGVSLWKMRTGRLSDRPEEDDFPRIGEAMAVLSEAPIFIDDSPIVNVMEIRTKARRLQAEHGLGLMVVDYLQLMEGPGSDENRVQEIAKITRNLKSIARELNVPVLVLSQLSRATEMRSPPIPKLSDLRESGTIEQDADVVMFIYREDVYKKDTPRRHIADIIIAKHRNGPTGSVELFFDEQRVSYRNLERRMAPPPVTGLPPAPPVMELPASFN